MAAKAIYRIFLTVICMLLMPLARAHPGHTTSGPDHYLLVFAIGLLAFMIVSLILKMAMGRKTPARRPGSIVQN